MDTFKKLFGPASSRDPRMSVTGTFGNAQARQAQKSRLAAKPKQSFGKSDIRSNTASRKGSPSAMQMAERSAMDRMSLDEKIVSPKKKDVAKSSPKKAPAKKAASKPAAKKAPSKAPAKSSPDKGLAAARMLGGKGGLSEDNAVMKRLRQRAMERAVKKMKGK
jgi:hypothetical protein